VFHNKGKYILSAQEFRTVSKISFDISNLIKSSSHCEFFSSRPFGASPIYGETYVIDPRKLPSPTFNQTFNSFPTVSGGPISVINTPPLVDWVNDLDSEKGSIEFCGEIYDLHTFPDKSVLIRDVGEGWDEFRAFFKNIHDLHQSIKIKIPSKLTKRAYFF
jgi:hypothetical protein